MENAPRFPLRRLPFLALRKVLRLMDICEQYKLATVSRRTKNMVKQLISNKANMVQFDFTESLTIKMWNYKNETSFTFKINEPEENDYIRTESIKTHITFLKDVFQFESIELKFSNNRPLGCETWILPVFQENIAFTTLTVHDAIQGRPNDEVYSFIINKGFNLISLNLFMKTSTDYKLNVSDCPTFSCNGLEIFHGHWVTEELLLTKCMNVKILEINNRKFDANEVKRFIKKWISGSRLKFAYIELHHKAPLRMVFNDIDAVEVREALVYSKYESFYEGGAFVVKQLDGTEALVFELGGELNLMTDFSLDLKSANNEDNGKQGQE